MSALFHITHKKWRSSASTSKHCCFNSTHANQVWHLFVSKTILWNGRATQTITITDDYTKKVIHVGLDTHLPDLGVLPVLELLKKTHPLPQLLFVNNGMEFLSIHVDIWCKKQKVAIAFSENRPSAMPPKMLIRTKDLTKLEPVNSYKTVREALVAAKKGNDTKGNGAFRKKYK